MTLVSRETAALCGCRPQDIQILTPDAEGALGVGNLNQILQKHLNPPAPGQSEREMEVISSARATKIVQIRNNYQMEWEIQHRNQWQECCVGVFNGDLGMIGASTRIPR